CVDGDCVVGAMGAGGGGSTMSGAEVSVGFGGGAFGAIDAATGSSAVGAGGASGVGGAPAAPSVKAADPDSSGGAGGQMAGSPAEDRIVWGAVAIIACALSRSRRARKA